MTEPTPELDARSRLQSHYKRFRPSYDYALRRMVRRVRGRMASSELRVTVKSRVKTFDSFYSKMVRLQASETTSTPSVNDLLGIRLVCPFLGDVERIARYLCEHFQVLEEERKGDERSFREFGYDSIHLLLAVPERYLPESIPGSRRVCEVQVRTTLQEAWAEIEHELIYKTDLNLPDESVRRKLASLNASLTLSDIIFQELRDYQLEQKRSRAQRHQLLHQKAAEIEAGHLPLVFEHNPSEEPPILTNGAPQKKVEKCLMEALQAHSDDQLDRAVRLYTQVLRLDPEPQVRSVVLNHRGMASFQLNDFDGALDDFNAAVEHNPQNHRAYYNRSLIYCALRCYDEALVDLERSLAMNRLHVESWYGRARVLFETREYAQAQTACATALDLEPQFAPAVKLQKRILAKLRS